MDDVEYSLDSLLSADHRDFDKMRNMILDDPEISGSLHLDVYKNPTYKGFEHGIPDAMTILDRLKESVKNGETLTLDEVRQNIDNVDAILRSSGSFVSSESLWILQDVLRKDPELAPLCKDFVEDIVQGGF